MALIKCIECQGTVSDKAISCPHCGLPLQDNKPIRSTKKFKKNPNGYGQIKKLSGNRRNPYAVYPPTKEYRDNGTPITRSAIGYYPTYQKAQEALATYNVKPYDVEKSNYTLKQVLDLYIKSKEINKKRKMSDSTLAGYKSCIKYFEPIWDRKIGSIITSDMQTIIDDGLTYGTAGRAIMLARATYKYAMQNDIIQKDYAKYLENTYENVTEKGVPFFDDEIDVLKAHKDDIGVQFVLALIYTGMRISEPITASIDLENDIIIGGVKTNAGKNRIIPIHPYVKPFIENGVFDYDNANAQRRVFNHAITKLGLHYAKSGEKHTPHDCRHTFSWLCDKYNVSDTAKHKLMGHAKNDIEVDVYGHRTLDELRLEMLKLR